MPTQRTAVGTVEYADRIPGCINEVYRGAYLDGQYKGKQVILKYAEGAGAEARLIDAVADADVETPRVLESGKDYIILEHKEMKNLADYIGNISPEKIANSLASFHAKLYLSRPNIEDKIIDNRTEQERTSEKISRITKEHLIYRAARALWSSFTTEASRYSLQNEIKKLIQELPIDESIVHRDQTLENAITDGHNINFIDFRWLGKAYFVTDVAKLALCLKSETSFDEKTFLDAYYTKLDSLLGNKINKTNEQFQKEYKTAKLLVGLSWAPIYVDCLSDSNRQSIAPARLETFVHSAFDEMNNKQRNAVLSVLSNNDNKYSQEILKSANKWRKQNQSRARIWLDDKKRTLFRHLTPLQAASAGLAFAATIAYGHYQVSKFLEEHPVYAAKAETLLQDAKKMIAQTEEFDEKWERYEKKLKEQYPPLTEDDIDDEELRKLAEEELK